MKDTQKHKLFKRMIHDILVTFQRDHDNMEVIKHEISQRKIEIFSNDIYKDICCDPKNEEIFGVIKMCTEKSNIFFGRPKKKI